MWPRRFLHPGACRQLRDKICSRRRHTSGQCGYAQIHFADPSPRKVVGVDASCGGHSTSKTLFTLQHWPFRVLTVAKIFDRLQLHVEPTATTLIRDRRAEVLLGCK